MISLRPLADLSRPERLDLDTGSLWSLFEASPQPMLICAAGNGPVLHANRAALRLYGECRDQLVGRPYRGPAPGTGAPAAGRRELHAAAAGTLHLTAYHLPVRLGGAEGWLVSLTETGIGPAGPERPRLVDGKVQLPADLDGDTGLRNLRGFLGAGELWLALARRVDEPAALFLIRVVNLRAVREAVGEAGSVRELHSLALLLQQNFRESDLVARVHTSTFAALLMAPDLDAARVAMHRLRHTIDQWNVANRHAAMQLAYGAALTEHRPGQPSSLWRLGREALNDLRSRMRAGQDLVAPEKLTAAWGGSGAL